MSSASNNKRSWTGSGVSVDKRQRLSSENSENLEFEESEALIEQVDGDDTKFRTGCIYLLTCIITGLVYVGQTLDYKNRMKTHIRSGKNPKQYFGRAIRKYGWENFTKDILIDDVPEEDLNNLEINYIAFYNSFGPGGYNCTIGGGGTSGYKHTEEQLQAQSKRTRKNHDVDGGGSIYFNPGTKKWLVRAMHATSDKRHIGVYLTKEKACQALKLYNETGERMPSDTSKRQNGTGCVHLDNESGKYQARENGKHIGYYFTEEKAFEALELYNKNGQRMPSDVTIRRRGTGSIRELFSKTKGTRFNARYRSKSVGVFDTYEEADQALKIHIENLKK